MTDQEIKDFITAELNTRLTKVRIPELPENISNLSALDKIAIHCNADNRTKHETLGDLANWLALGGDTTSITPDMARKGAITFKASAAQAGTNQISLPQFAGKNFLLSIDGIPQLDNEYEVLSAGGFKITIPDYIINEGQRFSLQFAEPVATGSTPSTTVGGFIRGTVTVSTNTTLTAADTNKLIQIKGGASNIAVMLPDVTSLADNSFFLLETHLGNSTQQAVKTGGGQNIYLNTTSKTTLYLAPGEVLFLYRKSDGWYVLNDFAQTYNEVGAIQARHKAGMNEYPLEGQLVKKTDVPRLWEYAQTLGTSILTEADWQSSADKGCYADNGDYLRLPDFRNMFLRGTTTGRKAGSYEADQFKAHSHRVDTTGNQSSVDPGDSLQRSSASGDGYNANGTGIGNPYIESVGGTETNPKNIAVVWTVKA